MRVTDIERKHRSSQIACELLRRIAEVLKTRVIDLAYPGMLGQPGCDVLSVRTLALESERQGLDAAQRQPGFEGADRRPSHPALQAEPVRAFLGGCDHAASGVPMPAEVFRRRVEHHVDAERGRIT